MEGYFVMSLPTRYLVLVVHVYFGYIEVVTSHEEPQCSVDVYCAVVLSAAHNVELPTLYTLCVMLCAARNM